MKILITGGTGLIGSNLCKDLIAEYHNIDITVLTRNSSLLTDRSNKQIKFIDNLDNLKTNYNIIINLAGDPINKGRWTSNKKT